MTPRLNLNLDNDTQGRLKELKQIYEKKLGNKMSLALVVRTAIYNALIAEGSTYFKMTNPSE